MNHRAEDPDLHLTDRDGIDARKRQRSKSDPELRQAGSSTIERLSDGIAQPERRASDNPRSNVEASRTPSHDETPISRGGNTSRRREANRLAAQRFRSRKKGYQDSLEERIRVLEEERDVLLNRLGEGPGESSFRLSDSTGGQGPVLSAAGSPEKKDVVIDVDVRIASLEAANRRLQEELKVLYEENEALRDELDRWWRWDVDTQPNLASQVGHNSEPRPSVDPYQTQQESSVQRHPVLPPPRFPDSRSSGSPSPVGIRLPPLRMHLNGPQDGPLPSPSALSFKSRVDSRPVLHPRSSSASFDLSDRFQRPYDY